MYRMEKARVEWADILKILGIIAVFCGHLGEETGKLHDFVFYYHVPLFFFASGIFAGSSKELSFKDVVKKRFGQIMLPYIFLTFINMGVIIVTSDKNFIIYLKYIKQFIFGIRNQIPASSLWFFSCIFCTGVLFEILRRLLKKNVLILLTAAALYFISITLFPNNPSIHPSWIWNVDSACYYLIYYALGYALHTRLLDLMDWKQETDKKTVVLLLIGITFLAGYVLSVYLQEDIIGNILNRAISGFSMIYPVVRAMLIIFFNLILAKILEGFPLLACAGTQTLWLCGNEMVVKKILEAAVSLLGMQIEITGVLPAIIYAAVMAAVIIRVLLPIEKKLYQKYLLKGGKYSLKENKFIGKV